MPRPRRVTPCAPLDDARFAVRQRKALPHQFVLDAIAALSPTTRPMFGCLAVYVASDFEEAAARLRTPPRRQPSNRQV